MIKLTSLLKEFTPNPAETPEIYYGNEKRKYFQQPSLDNQDMNAINPTYPIPEADMCTECGGAGCSQCGHEEESGDVWGQPSEDHESTMARGELKSLISNASKIYSIIEPGTELPGWVSAYITLASDYMNSVAQYASEASSH
jgi:hypothetical protein